MKKTTKLLAGAALIASLSMLSGCQEKPYTVYGPPPETSASETPVITDLPDETELPETATPSDTPSPATEEVVVVYGPPPDMEKAPEG